MEFLLSGGAVPKALTIQLDGSEHRLRVDVDEIKQLVVQLRGLISEEHAASQKTFGELAEEWSKRVSKRRVDPGGVKRSVKHLGALAHLKESTLKKSAIDEAFTALLQANGGPLAPQSINPLRAVGRRIIRDAQANGEWIGPNPFDGIERLPEAEPVHGNLLIDEARRLLAFLLKRRMDRYRLVKVMLVAGMRPGEAFALQKVDVDLIHNVLTIRRSNGRNQTKTGKERTFPIPDSIVGDLRSAMAASPNDLVFPGTNGKRQTKDSRLAKYLRAAMGRAGIVTGFRHICRRSGCGFREERLDGTQAPCPRCAFKLWVSPIPKHLRFYDLRHTAATLHGEAGCHPKVVQKVLGHAATNTTEQHYYHFNDAFIRAELSKLQLGDAT